jgi:hypothetical protein
MRSSVRRQNAEQLAPQLVALAMVGRGEAAEPTLVAAILGAEAVVLGVPAFGVLEALGRERAEPACGVLAGVKTEAGVKAGAEASNLGTTCRPPGVMARGVGVERRERGEPVE